MNKGDLIRFYLLVVSFFLWCVSEISAQDIPAPPSPPTNSNLLIIETMFGKTLGQAGNMFDVISLRSLTILNVDINLISSSVERYVEVYTKVGTHVGFEKKPQFWEMIACSEVQGMSLSNPTNVGGLQAVYMEKLQSRAFYITVSSGRYLSYDIGGRVGQIIKQNADLQILVGTGNTHPFGSSFPSRIWNGRMYYQLGAVTRRFLQAGGEVSQCMPSQYPTSTPTSFPIHPSAVPTLKPTMKASVTPSVKPSRLPSETPSKIPTSVPSVRPTKKPSAMPSARPSNLPSVTPTRSPSTVPSTDPTRIPTITPSKAPSDTPSSNPTKSPSFSPSQAPTGVPTGRPTISGSFKPSMKPSSKPTDRPSDAPSTVPSSKPTNKPTTKPSLHPSESPVISGTMFPSTHPSPSPSSLPSTMPTDPPSLQVSGESNVIVAAAAAAAAGSSAAASSSAASTAGGGGADTGGSMQMNTNEGGAPGETRSGSVDVQVGEGGGSEAQVQLESNTADEGAGGSTAETLGEAEAEAEVDDKRSNRERRFRIARGNSGRNALAAVTATAGAAAAHQAVSGHQRQKKEGEVSDSNILSQSGYYTISDADSASNCSNVSDGGSERSTVVSSAQVLATREARLYAKYPKILNMEARNASSRSLADPDSETLLRDFESAFDEESGYFSTTG